MPVSFSFLMHIESFIVFGFSTHSMFHESFVYSSVCYILSKTDTRVTNDEYSIVI